jgi:serine/threonine-protein kinase
MPFGQAAHTVNNGQSLKDIFDSGTRLERSIGVRIVLDLLAELRRLHESGMLHRNVHPGCVTFSEDGRVRLAGLELSKRKGDSVSPAPGEMSGLIKVLAPEQVLGGTIDERTDLYHCGLILYRLVAGRPAFESQGAWSLAKKVVSEDPVAPARVDPEIPQGLSDLIARSLSRNPADRFASAAEFAEQLARV